MPQCSFSGGVGGSDARIVWITEPAPAAGDDSDTVRLSRALEYRDAAGVTRRIKF